MHVFSTHDSKKLHGAFAVQFIEAVEKQTKRKFLSALRSKLFTYLATTNDAKWEAIARQVVYPTQSPTQAA